MGKQKTVVLILFFQGMESWNWNQTSFKGLSELLLASRTQQETRVVFVSAQPSSVPSQSCCCWKVPDCAIFLFIFLTRLNPGTSLKLPDLETWGLRIVPVHSLSFRTWGKEIVSESFAESAQVSKSMCWLMGYLRTWGRMHCPSWALSLSLGLCPTRPFLPETSDKSK